MSAKADDTWKHHLDSRADKLIAEGAGNPNELLTTREVAAWLGVSEQWLEIGRHKGCGPPYVRLTPRMIRYTRGGTLKYLEKRTHHSTAEYATKRKNRRAEART